MRQSPKKNLSFALSCGKVYEPFFNQTPSVTAIVCLDILKDQLMCLNFIKMGITYFFYKIELYLTGTQRSESIWMSIFSRRWIGYSSEENLIFQPWPPYVQKKTKFSYYHFLLISMMFNNESKMFLLFKLTVTCLDVCGLNSTIVLITVELQVEHTL